MKKSKDLNPVSIIEKDVSPTSLIGSVHGEGLGCNGGGSSCIDSATNGGGSSCIGGGSGD